MIKIEDATPGTQEFLKSVGDIVNDAQYLGGQRTKKAIAQVADSIARRSVAEVSLVNPADVQLTDEQWEQLLRKVRIVGGGPASQW